MKRALPPFLAAAALLGGCQSTSVAPSTGADFKLEEDERRIWARVGEEESSLQRSGFVATIPEVEQYLDRVVAGLYREPIGDGRLHVRVVADPTLNAFALPNGALFIHTGMLARLDNEAQLAAVLAHELTHAVHRHGLRSYRSMKNHTAFASSILVGTGGSLVGLLGAMGTLSSAAGYSQSLEHEADENGFRLVVAAGYAPRESVQVFRVLLEESKRSKIKNPFFFSSHPRLTERIDHFEKLYAALPPERQRQGKNGEEEFAAVLPAILNLNAQAALHAGDLDFARDSAMRCRQLQPGNATAAYFLAEVHRRRPGESDQASALLLYREAVERDPNFVEAHRGIGLQLLRARELEAAAKAFRRYLELKPKAEDRVHIENFIQQCEPTS
jgi:beta-barrel assembly-enhancing protease